MRKKIQALVVLGIISILGITSVQLYLIQKAYTNEEREFSEKVHIALKRVAEEMATAQGVSLPYNSPVKQTLHNNYVVQTGSEINADLLAFYLNKQFTLFNILADYEYAYYDCFAGKMVYGKYVMHQDASKVTKTELASCLGSNYYFVVKFPRSNDYLKSKLWFWKLTSLILFLVILFFGYALFVVFKQKSLSEIQKDFVNTVSHEIKTPVSTIAISANVLMQPSIIHEPARLLNYASIIKSENERLLHLSDKILQMARTEKSDFSLSFETFQVHDVIEDIVTKMTEKSFINLQLNAKNKTIKADRTHFTNIIFNLLDNAIKYSSQNISITITTENRNKHIAISITDNGIGIKQEHQKYIFQKFYRVVGVNLPNVKGFGLGLHYVKNIVVAHKWNISVQSELDKGSTFTILIPTL